MKINVVVSYSAVCKHNNIIIIDYRTGYNHLHYYYVLHSMHKFTNNNNVYFVF